MGADQGVVGPVPEGKDPEDYDKVRRRVLWSMPYGLYVLGSRAGDRYNLMTLNWVTQLSFEPKLVGTGVERDALTRRLVEEGGAFSLCFVDREDRALVRKFTKPVDFDVQARTANGFPYHEGRTGVPILDQAMAYVECQVTQQLDVGSHVLFVGEVVDAAFQKPEDTPVLRMEDTRMSYGG